MRRIATAALALAFATVGGGTAATRSSNCPRDARLGALAFVRGGSLRVVDLATCKVRVLVGQGVQPPVRWSHDGRWIAFGEAGVVRASGGRVLRPIGSVRAWTWSPTRDLLAGVSPSGRVVTWVPHRPRQRLATGFERTFSLAFDPSGRWLALERDAPSELWLVNAATRRQIRLARFSPRYAGLMVAGWFPAGRRVLFWGPYQGESIAADGTSLKTISAGGGRPTSIAFMLRYSDFMAWCGTRLVVAAGFDRYATRGKRLVAAAPPAWRPRPLVGGRRTSWISPACSSDGVTVAAAAGRNFEEPRFGQEHRSIWRLGSGGANPRRLTRPPVGVTDEQPRWARDGRSILFVRTHDSFGRLYLVRLNGSLVGPITDLGTTGNYYGHYGWADQTDWYQPR